MIYKNLFALLFCAFIQWHGISACKTATKICQTTKIGVDSVKDFTTHFKMIATTIGGSLSKHDMLLLASYAGPMGGFFSVGLGVAAFVLSQQQKGEIKAAVEILGAKMDSLSIQMKDSQKELIAHIENNRFKDFVTTPITHLTKIYFDFYHSLNDASAEEDRTLFEETCKKYMPLEIFDNMEIMLQQDSDHILNIKKYTDKGYSAFKMLYDSAILQLIPLYSFCAALKTNISLPESERIKINNNRLKKYERRIVAIYDHLERINSSRTENMWNLMPEELKRFHNEYAQMPLAERKKKEFANRIAYQFSEDYLQLNYTYAFGVIKNREKKKKLYAFLCKKEVCQTYVADNYIVWILRTHKHCNGKKQHFTLHTSPRACLQFEAELYTLYDTDGPYRYNATSVMETFMKNCKIENGIALFRYSERLRGDSDGIAQKFDGRRRYRPQTDQRNGKMYTFTTKHKPYLHEQAYFRDSVFWSDCPRGEPFDFMKHYCSEGSVWPNCILKEAAWEFHQLTEHRIKTG